MTVDKLLRAFSRALDWVLASLMAFLLVAVSCQVVARYIFRFSFSWSEELPVLVFVWLAYLGGAGALNEGRHLSVLFIRDALPPTIQRVLKRLGDILILAFLIYTLIPGWELSIRMGYFRFTTIPLSRYWLFLAVPVGSLCMIPFVVKSLVRQTVGAPEMEEVPHKPQQSLLG